MHPRDCPSWEYQHHQSYQELPARCAGILVRLRQGQVNVNGGVRDTRPFHHVMFVALTPKGCDYFAGHYRGEKYRCLEFYRVMIQGDPRVGTPPETVSLDLANFVDHIVRAGLSALHAGFAIPAARLPNEDKLIFLVAYACRLLVEFLRIHPYANGNGHIARLIVWMILSEFGFWPRRWPLNTSPPYHQLIFDYRNGNQEPLERFVLQSIVGQ